MLIDVLSKDGQTCSSISFVSITGQGGSESLAYTHTGWRVFLFSMNTVHVALPVCHIAGPGSYHGYSL